MRTFVLILGIVVGLSGVAFGQQVQTCSQAAAFSLETCKSQQGRNARCQQVTEENRQNCLKTGTWERRTGTGAKAGPDIPGLRKE